MDGLIYIFWGETMGGLIHTFRDETSKKIAPL